LGSDPGILGRQLLLNGEKFTVAGVTSPEFDSLRGRKSGHRSTSTTRRKPTAKTIP